MVVLSMQRLEIFRIVRQEDGVVLATPRYQFRITCVLTEPVFRLFDVVSAFPEESFEDPTNVFVKQNSGTRQFTVSLGFSDDSRTRSNAVSFSCSTSRISSMCA